eukprot:Pgem_evm3s531
MIFQSSLIPALVLASVGHASEFTSRSRPQLSRRATPPSCVDVTKENNPKCFADMLWVKTDGLYSHPEWYKTLSVNSTLQDIQQFLYNSPDNSNCPIPCIELPYPSELSISSTEKYNKAPVVGKEITGRCRGSGDQHNIGVEMWDGQKLVEKIMDVNMEKKWYKYIGKVNDKGYIKYTCNGAVEDEDIEVGNDYAGQLVEVHVYPEGMEEGFAAALPWGNGKIFFKVIKPKITARSVYPASYENIGSKPGIGYDFWDTKCIGYQENIFSNVWRAISGRKIVYNLKVRVWDGQVFNERTIDVNQDKIWNGYMTKTNAKGEFEYWCSDGSKHTESLGSQHANKVIEVNSKNENQKNLVSFKVMLSGLTGKEQL